MTRDGTVRNLIQGPLLALALALTAGAASAAAPDGQLTWAVPISVSPALADPADYQNITSLLALYALHDALVKPMPGAAMAPSLAESWSVTRDGLVYEFVLRRDVHFHNGDQVTAADVKFSFERYRGVSSRLLQDKVAAVEIADQHRDRKSTRLNSSHLGISYAVFCL